MVERQRNNKENIVFNQATNKSCNQFLTFCARVSNTTNKTCAKCLLNNYFSSPNPHYFPKKVVFTQCLEQDYICESL